MGSAHSDVLEQVGDLIPLVLEEQVPSRRRRTEIMGSIWQECVERARRDPGSFATAKDAAELRRRVVALVADTLAEGAAGVVDSTRQPLDSRSSATTERPEASTAPSASAAASNETQKPCASTIPLSGEWSAATHRTEGSSVDAAAASISPSDSTPFVRPRESKSSTISTSASSQATISLPVRRCGTRRSAHHAYSRSRPSTQVRAFRLPAG